MSLYEDDDDVPVAVGGDALTTPGSAAIKSSLTGWTKSINWMQSQQKQTLATKKRPETTPKTISAVTTLPPVVNLMKSSSSKRRVAEDSGEALDSLPRFPLATDKLRSEKGLMPLNDPNWKVVNEYDPLWPNDYHNIVQEMRDAKRSSEPDEAETKKRRYTESGRDKARERFHRGEDAGAAPLSGFSRRPNSDSENSDDGDADGYSRRKARLKDADSSRRSGSGHSSSAMVGAAIAPPPSLTESSSSSEETSSSTGQGQEQPGMSFLQKMASTPAASSGLGVAAKIMAKYGYKHGQGLGRSEQGMSQALSVEKTSKRGGRIVHEKELMPPPPLFGEDSSTPPPGGVAESQDAAAEDGTDSAKPSITDLMRNPSKVVLCKNMVGPGEVDAELEPEVKDECHNKYGDVNKVVIFEVKDVPAEEAVRIFIEFKRVESAIKAVVDLNGRFFGGREVAASFYDLDKFQNLQLAG